MRIGIYTPYLDTAGGGEKYMLTIAECLSKNNEVDVFLDTHLSTFPIDEIKKKNEIFLGLDLSKVRYKKAPFGEGASSKSRYTFLKNYDVIFYNTDGSIFFSSAKKSILHFQMPFENHTGIVGKIKLRSWKEAIYNSIFTKEFVEQFWNIGGEVIYPPVDTDNIKPLKKEKIILSVGRFVKATKVKKHEDMIDAFGKLQKEELKDWKLYLAGGIAKGDEDYLKELRDRAEGLGVEFFPNLSRNKLYELYGKASIYWHFMGFGEEDPMRFEHFGITTVEAMAGGCIPIVINKGGQREIIENGKDGYVWDSLDKLYPLTLSVAGDEFLRENLSKEAVEKAKKFSKKNFEEAIEKLANG